MPRTGRPTKLTPKLQQEIVDNIMRGAYIETAAAATGLHKSTFYDWLKTGKRLNEHFEKDDSLKPTVKEKALMDFSDAIQKAISESELRDVGVIDDAAQSGIWQAAAWRLERKNHAQWGRKMAITDADGGSLVENAVTAWSKALADSSE
jgi:hypothetical protein